MFLRIKLQVEADLQIGFFFNYRDKLHYISSDEQTHCTLHNELVVLPQIGYRQFLFPCPTELHWLVHPALSIARDFISRSEIG